MAFSLAEAPPYQLTPTFPGSGEPSEISTSGKWDLGWLPVLSVVGAAGLMLVSFGDSAARSQLWWAQGLFWSGLLLIVLPAMGRLLSTGANRSERLALIVMVGLMLYAVKILNSPNAFTYHD